MERDEFPKDGDYYYWISTNTGDICESMWVSRNDFCKFRLSIGNVFESWDGAKMALAELQHKVEDRRRAMK